MQLDKAVLGALPSWLPEDLSITHLSQGQTNRSFRLQSDNKSWVLRINNPADRELGIVRSAELKTLWFASAAGLSPRIVAWNLKKGWLLREWLDGTALDASEMTTPDTLHNLCAVLKQVHSWRLKLPYVPMSVSGQRYVDMMKNPDKSDWERLKELRKLEIELDDLAEPRVVCHKDPLYTNFLKQEKLWLIDWEYAGMADPMFDLSMLSHYHRYDADQWDDLLRAYFGETNQGHRRKFDLFRQAAGLLDQLWQRATEEN